MQVYRELIEFFAGVRRWLPGWGCCWRPLSFLTSSDRNHFLLSRPAHNINGRANTKACIEEKVKLVGQQESRRVKKRVAWHEECA